MKNKIKIDVVNIGDLKVNRKNPRKTNYRKFKALKDSLNKYGFINPLIVNSNPKRQNIIVSGHQRMLAWGEMGNDEVPVIFINLTKKEEEEANVRLNRSAGEFDFDILAEIMPPEKLKEIGFDENELKKAQTDFEQRMKNITNENCIYPIVPKFNEKYNYVVVLCENEMDYHHLITKINLPKQKTYKEGKTQKTGKGKIIAYREMLKYMK